MPLVPYVPFTSGSAFTPDIANEIARPTFDNQTQYFGHLPKIQDTDLDDGVNSIKARVANNELNLRVTAGSGLNALVSAGRVIYGTTVYNVGATSLTLAASASNFLYVDVDGVVKVTTGSPPIVRALLAIVVTNTSGVINIFDLREGYKVETIRPLNTTIRNFGGRGDSGAFSAAGGEVLSEGEYYFTDFIVPAGRVITISKLARIYCTGVVNIAGTVFVTTGSAGAPTIAVRGFQVSGGVGQGFGGGQGELPADTYNHILSPVGSGGGGGYYHCQRNDLSGFTSRGGAGGGCFWIESAGNIVVTGTIQAKGSDGENSFSSGTAGNYQVTAGGGGGSGGLVLLKSLTNTIVSGIIDVSGGRGGNGFNNQSLLLAAEDGSGGGGGRIVIYSPNINTTGSTLNISGGAPGTGWAAVTNPNVSAIGGVGGSYGGQGGTQTGNGVVGANGVLSTKFFTPIG